MAWPTTPGTGGLTIDGVLQGITNLYIGSGGNVGSGQYVMAIANATTVPVSLAALAGVVLYARSGHLFALGQLGTLTQVSSA